MSTTLEQERLGCWSEEFWVQHCEGFRVEHPNGPVGVVEGIRRDLSGEVEALLVRERGALHVVPVAHLEVVDESRELVTLRLEPALHSTAVSLASVGRR